MIHIIFAGCSFSDDGRETDDFDDSQYHENMGLLDLRFPTTIKIHQLLTFDLKTQKIDGIKIHTIARGSYGNHVIFDKLKQKVEEIKKSTTNEKIYAAVQLSAFARRGLKNSTEWFKMEDYPLDYPIQELNYSNINDVKDFYSKHLDNIINMNEYLSNQNIISYFYFGWANIFTSDVTFCGLENKMEKLKEFVRFYEYNDALDEIEFFCGGNKKIKNEKRNNSVFKKIYEVESDKYGGLLEYSRDVLNMGERYHLIFDPHPSSKTYYMYYINFIRKWFIENNIINDKQINEKFIKLLDFCFEFEYNRFISTMNCANVDYAKINILSFNLIKTENYNDVEAYKNKFKSLCKKFI